MKATAAERVAIARPRRPRCESWSRTSPRTPTFRRSLAGGPAAHGPRCAKRGAALRRRSNRSRPHDALAWHERRHRPRTLPGASTKRCAAAERAIAIDPCLPELHNHLGILRGRTLRARGCARLLRPCPRARSQQRARLVQPRERAARRSGGGGGAGSVRKAMRARSRATPTPATASGCWPSRPATSKARRRCSGEILGASPGHHESRLNLAVVYVRQKRVAEARAELREDPRRAPRPGRPRSASRRSFATCPGAIKRPGWLNCCQVYDTAP